MKSWKTSCRKECKPPENPSDVASIIKHNTMVLFYEDEDPWSYMLRSILSNIGATTVKQIDVGGGVGYGLGWMVTSWECRWDSPSLA